MDQQQRGIVHRCVRAVASKAVLNCCRRILLAQVVCPVPTTATAPIVTTPRCCDGDGDAESDSHGLSSTPTSSDDADALGSRQTSTTSLCADDDAITRCGRRAAAVVQGALGMTNAIAGREFTEQVMLVAADLATDALAACAGIGAALPDAGGDTALSRRQAEECVDEALRRIEASGALGTAIDRLFDLSARWAGGLPLVENQEQPRHLPPFAHRLLGGHTQAPAGLICF